MITSIANFLQDLQAKEAAKLDRERITHAPTIGEMYEGLTRSLLDRAIPSALNLRVVDGFIEDHEGNLSPQIDAMLVAGDGREIPHTTSYVWPIQRVIAVLEVKKNLYGADLDDAFRKLRDVNDMHGRYMRQNREGKFKVRSAYQAFARLTGRYPRKWKDANALPDKLSFIFHTLVCEQLSPVRIIFGYEGYVDELGLRDGFWKFIDGNLATPQGFGIGSFPTLIVCRKNSLLKMNGQPYICPLADGWWPAVASNAENPIRLLIELIWTRLANEFASHFPMDDALQMERLAPFLSTRLGHRNGMTGWEYRQESLNREQLDGIEPTNWEPEGVDENEWVVLMQVANKGELDVREAAFRKYEVEEGFDPDELIGRLVAKRVLAWCDDYCVRLISQNDLITAFMPDGNTVTSGETDLLSLWFQQELKKRRAEKRPKSE